MGPVSDMFLLRSPLLLLLLLLFSLSLLARCGSVHAHDMVRSMGYAPVVDPFTHNET